MTLADCGFVVDAERVVHETIDDETILIQLDTGTYYSLAGCGSEVWELLAGGLSLSQADAVLRRRYASEADLAAGELRRFAAELVAEELLLRVPSTGSTVPAADPPPRDFAAPVLNRYTDMEYFLRLDPVHEADAALGWPAPASDSATG